MTNQKLRDENNALLRKIWATGHCDSALQTEIALLLDARVREIEKLQSAVEPTSKHCQCRDEGRGPFDHDPGCPLNRTGD